MYIRLRSGVVDTVVKRELGMTEVIVVVEGSKERAIAYDELTGPVHPGDIVMLNTTAVYKALGTGGYHFVSANLSVRATEVAPAGHIMKLRYTPSQVKVLSAEEEDSPLSDAIRRQESLQGMPVIIGSLHSQVAPAAAALRQLNPNLCLAYVMTDGAALPMAFSRLIRQLKSKGILDFTVTCGHAFGGDLEAVNIYSALLAAKANGADAVIVAMGPGVVGTGSTFGCTALEQGQVVNAVHSLAGTAIAIPRLGFADSRERHRGLSHHTCTALGRVALAPCYIAIPQLPDDQQQLIMQRVREAGLDKRHCVLIVPGTIALESLKAFDLRVTTMGRSADVEPAFFLAAGAAALLAKRSLDDDLPLIQ